MRSEMELMVGVDVGGTFTDFVLLHHAGFTVTDANLLLHRAESA